MKRKSAGRLFFFLMCFAAANGFCGAQKEIKVINERLGSIGTELGDINKRLTVLEAQPPVLPPGPPMPGDPKPPRIVQERLVPVSWQIISDMRDSKIGFDVVPYYLSSPVKLAMSDLTRELVYADGALMETNKNASESIDISDEEPGKMTNPSSLGPGGSEVFDIFFADKNITLKFKRNMERNRFELVSASKGGKDADDYGLVFKTEKPYLAVNYGYSTEGESIQVQGIAAQGIARANDPRADIPQADIPQAKRERYSKVLPDAEIDGVETGKYYVQLAAFSNAEAAQSETARIGNKFPVVIVKANVNIRGEDTYVHRVLVGPVSYRESHEILRHFQAAYCDAFVRDAK